jgi:hypothetical protein
MSNSLLQYFRGLCFLDRLCLSFAPMVKRTGVISGFGGTQNDIGSFVRILLIITEPPSFKTFL